MQVRQPSGLINVQGATGVNGQPIPPPPPNADGTPAAGAPPLDPQLPQGPLSLVHDGQLIAQSPPYHAVTVYEPALLHSMREKARLN